MLKNRRLNARATRTEDHIYRHALGASNAAELAIRKVWDDLVKAIGLGGGPGAMNARLGPILDRLYQDTATTLAGKFAVVAETAHATTVANLKATLTATVEEAPEPDGTTPAELVTAATRQVRQEALADFLLAPPSPFNFLRTIYRGDWTRRLASITKLALPGVLAAAITAGTLELKSPYEIARDIRPLVQGVQVSARRIARTESLRIAHEIQVDTYEQLGDMIAGYQIHAVLDSRTRPHHRARDGFVYYKTPRPGEKGLDVMPRPPMEADGKYAFNCRCFLTPVFARVNGTEAASDRTISGVQTFRPAEGPPPPIATTPAPFPGT